MSRFFFLAQINKDFYDEVMRLEDSLPKKKFYLTFIEVQAGTYFGEDDIERIEDDFGR